ncbi:MAG: hypothetical protein QNJ31_02535 [Candidatus Caenarcaniphilales bacterium]|nr:hypothetical protein [Candidatus Caenarcaniphilales bacterium]
MNILNKIFTFAFTLLFLNALMLSQASDAGTVNAANGQWQYLIRRGDTNGVGGSFTNRNCPFYVGYFSLDFYPVNLDKRYKWKKNYKYVMKRAGNSSSFAVGDKSFEMRGSYTPYNADEYCSSPLTKTNKEKAPIRMTKISPNGRKLSWVTDYLQGTRQANVMWAVDANFNGKNSMSGRLKAYVCEGKGANRKCRVVNRAKFTAKRINSIQEMTRRPLFKKQKTAFQTLMDRIFPWLKEPEGVFEDNRPYPDFDSMIDSKYVKSSVNLKAVLPVKAFRCGNSDVGVEACVAKGGDSGCPCKVCKNFGCENGQEPTEEKIVCCFCQKGGTKLCKCPCSNPNTCAGNPGIAPSSAGCVK